MFIIANVGVPMLLVVGPILILGLLPIVLIEAGLYRWRLGIGLGKALRGSLGAHLLSTLVGVPLTWVALVILQIATGGGGAHGVGIQAVTWQAPWLTPYRGHLFWMIPAAGMMLCVPFMVASVIIERNVLYNIWQDVDRANIRITCWLANGTTYGCLIAFWGIQLIRLLSH